MTLLMAYSYSRFPDPIIVINYHQSRVGFVLRRFKNANESTRIELNMMVHNPIHYGLIEFICFYVGFFNNSSVKTEH